MTVKDGVDVSKLCEEIKGILPTAEKLWQMMFPEDADGMTITSGHEGSPGDGVHGVGSKHYLVNNPSGEGEAVDIRANDVLQWKATIYAGQLPLILWTVHRKWYKVFCEKLLTSGAHVHIELP